MVVVVVVVVVLRCSGLRSGGRWWWRGWFGIGGRVRGSLRGGGGVGLVVVLVSWVAFCFVLYLSLCLQVVDVVEVDENLGLIRLGLIRSRDRVYV